MLRLLRSKNGQSTAEYAILIGIVVAAVVGMQTWVNRSLKAKIADAADAGKVAAAAAVTWDGTIFTTNQFEPPVPGSSRTERTSPVREYFDTARNQWVIDLNAEGGEIINRTGNQTFTTQ